MSMWFLENDVEALMWCSLQSSFNLNPPKIVNSTTITCSQLSSTWQRLLIETVKRDFGKSMAKYGCPKKCNTLVPQLHDGMQVIVYFNNWLICVYNVATCTYTWSWLFSPFTVCTVVITAPGKQAPTHPMITYGPLLFLLGMMWSLLV